MSRKLVTLRKIDDLQPINGADLIEKASIDGWNVVVKKGEFSVGDYCLYFEIDSFLPIDDIRYDFLKKGNTKKMDGKEGVRIKTVKLKGVKTDGVYTIMNVDFEMGQNVTVVFNNDKRVEQ